MCGILSLYSESLKQHELNQLQSLFKINESRGGDSVGVFIYDFEKKDYIIYHDYIQSSQKINRLLNKLFFKKDNSIRNKRILIMGHTRLTATGTVKDAHPMISKNNQWVMIHNGVFDHKDFIVGVNDTQQTVDLVGAQGLHKDLDLKCMGSAWVLFNLVDESIHIGKLGFNPMELKKLNNGFLLSSIGLKNCKELSDHKDHFYRYSYKNGDFMPDIVYASEKFGGYSGWSYGVTNAYKNLYLKDSKETDNIIYIGDKKDKDKPYIITCPKDEMIIELKDLDNEIGKFNNKTGCMNCMECFACDDWGSY